MQDADVLLGELPTTASLLYEGIKYLPHVERKASISALVFILQFDLFTGTSQPLTGNPSKIAAPIVVIGSLIIGLLLLLFFKRRRQRKYPHRRRFGFHQTDK